MRNSTESLKTGDESGQLAIKLNTDVLKQLRPVNAEYVLQYSGLFEPKHIGYRICMEQETGRLRVENAAIRPADLETRHNSRQIIPQLSGKRYPEGDTKANLQTADGIETPLITTTEALVGMYDRSACRNERTDAAALWVGKLLQYAAIAIENSEYRLNGESQSRLMSEEYKITAQTAMVNAQAIQGAIEQYNNEVQA